jgi:hypothetical protein
LGQSNRPYSMIQKDLSKILGKFFIDSRHSG